MQEHHKKPYELSPNELEQITELIYSGGENPKGKILAVLTNAYLISFITENGKIISTTTVKKATADRRKLVFENTSRNYEDFLYELGFWVTLPEYWGKSLAINLFKNQLSKLDIYFKNEQIINPKLFCLIHNKKMINIFEQEFNFQNIGKEISSTFNETVFYLLVK